MTAAKHKKVLICDDRPERVARWAESVKSNLQGLDWEIECVTGKELSDLVQALGVQEQLARGTAEDTLERSALLVQLDEADLVILDSDLSPDPQDVIDLGSDGPEVSSTLRNQYGDTIARQIRTYSSAGFIVVVNMYWSKHSSRRVFDLTMTQGQDAFADLHIQEAELDDKSLWVATDPDPATFNPWLRPLLTETPELVERSESAVENLGAKVLETLELHELELSPRQLDVFGRIPAEEATFDDLAASLRGLKYPLDVTDEGQRRRMAASVVRRWLARVVLPAQDPVSDGAHLLGRFPQLLGEGIGDASVWESAAMKGQAGDDILPLAAPARIHQLSHFADRVVYAVDKARERVGSLPRPDTIAADLVFAENVSAFVPSSAAIEFEAEVSGTYFRRHLVLIKDEEVANEPFNRLLR